MAEHSKDRDDRSSTAISFADSKESLGTPRSGIGLALKSITRTKPGTLTVPHAFGVAVPDLPGCFSAGNTLDDALTNSREAILLHLEALLDDGQPFPAPSPISQLQKKRSYRGWTWAVVDVDVSELGDKAARVNITLPQRILRLVDAHARKQRETRSGFLARTAIEANATLRGREPDASRSTRDIPPPIPCFEAAHQCDYRASFAPPARRRQDPSESPRRNPHRTAQVAAVARRKPSRRFQYPAKATQRSLDPRYAIQRARCRSQSTHRADRRGTPRCMGWGHRDR